MLTNSVGEKSMFHENSSLLEADGFIVRYGQTYGIENYIKFFQSLGKEKEKIVVLENFISNSKPVV